MEKRIALINPCKPPRSNNIVIQNLFERCKKYIRPWYIPPLNLLTIASHIPNNYYFEIIDEDFVPIDFTIKYELVAITAMTIQAPRAYEISRKFKERKIPVAIGGIHPSVMPEEASRIADHIFIGESENTWPIFLDDFSQGNPKQIYNAAEYDVVDLSKSKVPRYDLLSYKHLCKGNDYFNMIPIQATRGCPHDCNFCIVSKIQGKKIRSKNVASVIAEIKFIKNIFGNRLIVFVDDNLFIDKVFIKELLIQLLPLKIKFCAQSDVSLAFDGELMDLAYAAGLQMVLIGLESLDENSLENLDPVNWKYRNLSKYSEVVNKIQNKGIIVYGTFILGFDSDNQNTFRILRDFIIENNCNAQFSFLTPFPGTRLFNQIFKSVDSPNEYDWSKFSFDDLIIYSKQLGPENTIKGLIWLYDEVYNENAFTKRFNYMKSIYKKLPPRWQL